MTNKLQAGAAGVSAGVTNKFAGLGGWAKGGQGPKVKDEPADNATETELTPSGALSGDGTPGVTTRRRAASGAAAPASVM